MFEITLMAKDHEPSIGIVNEPLIESGCLTKPSTHLDTSPKSEPTLVLNSSVEAHHVSRVLTQEEISEDSG